MVSIVLYQRLSFHWRQEKSLCLQQGRCYRSRSYGHASKRTQYCHHELWARSRRPRCSRSLLGRAPLDPCLHQKASPSELMSYGSSSFLSFLRQQLTNTTERVLTQTLAKRSLSAAIRRSKMCVIRSIALSRTASSMLWCGELLPNTFLKGLVWVTLFLMRMWYQSLVPSLVLRRNSGVEQMTDTVITYLNRG